MTHSTQPVAFITGASSGIGKACAYEFYRHGYSVVLFARRKEHLEALARDLKLMRSGGEALVLHGDVTDRIRVFEAIKFAAQKLGRIDVLINNAGAGLNAIFETAEPQAFLDILNLNVMGVLHCTQAVIPIMKQQHSGQIVNISSVIGKRAVPSRSAYCTSKFAVEGLSESIRPELKPYGIHVTVIRPTSTATEFFDVEARGEQHVESTGMTRMSADKVARIIYSAVQKKKRSVTISLSGKFMIMMNAIVPGLIDRIVLKMFGKLKKQNP